MGSLSMTAYRIHSRARVEFPLVMVKITSMSHPHTVLVIEKEVHRNWLTVTTHDGGACSGEGYCMLMGFITENSWGTPMKDWDRWEASV